MPDETAVPTQPVIVSTPPPAPVAQPAAEAHPQAAPLPPPAAEAELAGAGQAALLRLSSMLSSGPHVLALEGADGRVLVRLSQPGGDQALPTTRAAVRDPGGREVGAVCVAAPAAGAGAEPLLAAMAADAVERELALARARARVQAMEPLALLADFMAHELATPVTLLAGLLQLVATETVPEQRDELVERARQAAGELSRAVRDLGALGTGRSAQVHAAGTLVEEAVAGVAPPRGVAVTVDPGAEPLWVRGHAGLLRRAVRNLVLNAVQAAGDAGQVEVQVRAAADRVRITVSDVGPGIAPEHLPSLFWRPFSSRPGGNGLGLLFVRAVVESAHGGSLSYRPRTPRGAIFVIDLPRAAG
ncbi:MAG TPA: HAMP domain-containing sensor histidine kinase [Longimicrobium sp.]